MDSLNKETAIKVKTSSLSHTPDAKKMGTQIRVKRPEEAVRKEKTKMGNKNTL